MAEAVVLNITQKILGELISPAVKEVSKTWGVHDELEKLKGTVSTLQAVLLHAEKLSYQRDEIKVWLVRLKDVLYDAQDVLEECSIEALRRELRSKNEMMKQVRTFFSSSNQLAFKLKMSCKIRAIRGRLACIAADRSFHLEERSEVSMREETHSFVREQDIIGRDDAREDIVRFLSDLSMKENVSVLPIVGIGGLGKTALVQYIYNDLRVDEHFDLKMWICISDVFDVKIAVQKILESATKSGPGNVGIDQLQEKLRKEIDGKKYLLVLDDVWNEDHEKWISLNALLMGGARGSKIVITTRLPLVAEIAGTVPPYHLGSLSDSMSLDLLIRFACKEEDTRDLEEKRSIGEEIVKKCCGVPLAIRTIGSLLFFKKTVVEWQHFKDHDLLEVSRKEGGVNSILKLSYDHLPSHLKQCFAFCSLFPKDYVIDKQELMSLWMAEGFISHINGSTQDLEDIANGCFMNLLSRNFFQDITKDDFGYVETCKMHDLMHDLACLVAGTECARTYDSISQVHERARHVSYDPLVGFPHKLVDHMRKGNKLRTFIVKRDIWGVEIPISESACKELFSSSRSLRVLEFYCKGIKRLPSSISKLKHLTYLGIFGECEIEKLPNSITRLQNLQTLVLGDCPRLKELPRDIRKLVNLRQLSIDCCPSLCCMPRGLGQLTSLHGLTHFILPKEGHSSKTCGRLSELNRLNNLRGHLRIEVKGGINDEEAESKVANLIEKHLLVSLKLDFNNRDGNEILIEGLRPHANLRCLAIECFGGRWLPSWLSYMPNLVDLWLYNCERCRRLPPLGQLPCLKYLTIRDLRVVERIESGNHHNRSATTSFPLLSRLHIINCPKLKSIPPLPHVEDMLLWDVNPELLQLPLGLHKLKKLEILDMKSLEGLHEEFLQDLTSLEDLCIKYCDSLAHLPLGNHYNHSTTSFPRLSLLDIEICPKLKSIPPLPCVEHLCLNDVSPELLQLSLGLHKLKKLEIWSVKSLEGLHEEFLQDLTSLEDLCIRYCDSLAHLSLGNHHNHSTTTSFPRLSILDIKNCPKLKSIPPLPRVEYLWLENVSPELLQLSLGLHKLKKLEIWNVKFLEGLHEEFLQDLTSLEHLRIGGCLHLAHLSLGIRHLVNLERLVIWDCKELDLSIDEKDNTMEYSGLHKLSKVEIEGNSKLISLPSWLLHNTALQVLQIMDCPNLSALSEWMKDLQLLQELTISNCPSLTSLPEGMQDLLSLQRLKIRNCPTLEKRCRKHLGEDWYKIAHVPEITIWPHSNNDPSP